MILYGPHCHHDECAMTGCDYAPDQNAAVLFACRQVASCPHCGPGSPAWPRISSDWREWCSGAYGTTSPAELRDKGVPVNVVETAEVVAAHA